MGAATAVSGFAWWTFNRLVKRVDDSVANIALIRALLPSYVLEADADVEIGKVTHAIETMRVEGIAREARILEAVRDVGKNSTQENTQLRSEITGVHQRIDRIFEQSVRRDRHQRD